MAKPQSPSITSSDKNAEESKAAEGATQAGGENAEQVTEQAAARRPVRSLKGNRAKPPGGANKKPGKANQANRAARATREQGVNKPVPDKDKEDDEEEEGSETDAADAFWQYIVTASYRSRKTRLDWGGGEDGGD